MFERGISVHQVRDVLARGETIVHYSDDEPYPSRLVLGWSVGRPIHVVVADVPDGEKIVITVYEPDAGRWDHQFRRRR